MPVAVETPESSYSGNGSTTVFPTLFSYEAESEVLVLIDGAQIFTGYSVSTPSDDPNAGFVTFDTAPTSGQAIVVYRATPLSQPRPFTDPARSSLAEQEAGLNRLTRQLQERQAEISRTITYPPGTLESEVLDPTAFTASVQSIADTAQTEANRSGTEADRAQGAGDDALARAQAILDAIEELVPSVAFNFTTQVGSFNFTEA